MRKKYIYQILIFKAIIFLAGISLLFLLKWIYKKRLQKNETVSSPQTSGLFHIAVRSRAPGRHRLWIQPAANLVQPHGQELGRAGRNPAQTLAMRQMFHRLARDADRGCRRGDIFRRSARILLFSGGRVPCRAQSHSARGNAHDPRAVRGR